MSKEDLIQWFGAANMIAAQVITSLFPLLYPYNIVLFAIGGLSFVSWAVLVRNKPQIAVNIVGLLICAAGLHKAFI